jgi:hypothetical protein
MTDLPEHLYEVQVIQRLLFYHNAQAADINKNVNFGNTSYTDMRDLCEANLTEFAYF